MKEILETIILNLVENKDKVTISSREEEKITIFEVKVADSDMGKVIGRQGKIAKAIRTVMKSLAAKEHKKVVVEFVD
ncbi:MAG: KH domain-containing protein [Clostridia bacterium]